MRWIAAMLGTLAGVLLLGRRRRGSPIRYFALAHERDGRQHGDMAAPEQFYGSGYPPRLRGVLVEFERLLREMEPSPLSHAYDRQLWDTPHRRRLWRQRVAERLRSFSAKAKALGALIAWGLGVAVALHALGVF